MALNKPLTVETLAGTGTALITPFNEDGSLDERKLEMLVNDQINAGVDFLVAVATTGEDCTLDFMEQTAVASRIYQIADGRVPVVFGAGSNNTREAVKLMGAIEKAVGPSTFLHATGYKNNPPQEGIIRHFETLSRTFPESTIVMYSVSSRTGSKIMPDTQIHLMNDYPNIIGIKLAEPTMKEYIPRIINETRGNGVMVSGEDDMVAYIMENGGTGVISASANVAPKMFKRMTDAARNGNFEDAERMQEELLPLVDAVFCIKNPIPLKYMFGSSVRSPLVSLDEVKQSVVIKSLDKQKGGRKYNNGCEAVNDVMSMYTPEQLGIDLSKYRRMNDHTTVRGT